MADTMVKDEDENTNEVKSNRGRFSISGKNGLVAAAVGLALVGLVGTFVFYQKYQDVKSDPSSAQKAQNSAETKRVLDKLKQVLRVDETEAPTVARVEDPAKLQKANAEFYKNVQKGDYLVIFPKRAIIYREEINQIVNIAPIINTNGATKTDATDTTTTSNTKTTSPTTTKTTTR